MLTQGLRPADSGDHPDALHPVMPDMQKQGPMFARKRIVRGDSTQSGVFVRMATREQKLQMPPFATKQVDGQVGVPGVMAWIDSL